MDDGPLATPMDRARRAATWAAAAGVVVALGVAALVPFLPELHWEADPRAALADPAGNAAAGPSAASWDGAMVHAQAGPAAMAWFSVLVVAGSGLAIAACAWRSRGRGGGTRLAVVTAALVGLGIAAAWTHLGDSARDRYTLTCWIASACLGLACFHLARFAGPRRLLLAGFVALSIPWLVDALWYVLEEHAMTVARFEARADAIAEARGWTADSPQWELYVRRLTAPDVTGALGLSNVLGSLTAAAATAGLGLTLSGRRGSVALWAGGACAVAAAGVTLLTRSKGALAAMAVGIAVVVFMAWWRSRRSPGQAHHSPRQRWLPAALAVTAIAAPIVAVAVRGVWGPPEDWTGERSLLFRWFYLTAGLRIAGAMGPIEALRGLGIEGLSLGYLQAKNPLSPESVQALHQAVLDYALPLGLGGVAWVAALGGWFWRGGAVASGSGEAEGGELSPRAAGYLGLATAGAITAVWIGVEMPALWWGPTLSRLGAGLAMAAVIAAVVSRRAGSIEAAVGVGLFAAAVVLVCHGQIEMTWFHPPAVMLGWAMVGAAGGAGSAAVARGGRDTAGKAGAGGVVITLAVLVLAAALAGSVAAPASAGEARKQAAAEALRRGDLVTAIDRLDAAAAAGPADRSVLRWRVALRLEAASVLANRGRMADATRWLDQAQAVMDHAVDRHAERPSLWRIQRAVLDTRRRLLKEDHAAARAERLAAARAVVERSPFAMRDWLDLAQRLDASGRSDAARDAYRRVLELDAKLYLDPAMRLSSDQRAAVEARLDAP